MECTLHIFVVKEGCTHRPERDYPYQLSTPYPRGGKSEGNRRWQIRPKQDQRRCSPYPRTKFYSLEARVQSSSASACRKLRPRSRPGLRRADGP